MNQFLNKAIPVASEIMAVIQNSINQWWYRQIAHERQRCDLYRSILYEKTRCEYGCSALERKLGGAAIVRLVHSNTLLPPFSVNSFRSRSYLFVSSVIALEGQQLKQGCALQKL